MVELLSALMVTSSRGGSSPAGGVWGVLGVVAGGGGALGGWGPRVREEGGAWGGGDRRGVPLHDGRPAARNWARRYAERLSRTSRNDSKNSRQRKDCNNADDYR